MSLENFIPTKDSKTYPVVTASKKGKLIITKEVENAIDTLHATIGHREWSGPLFYLIEGDINKPEDIVITTKGLFPADIGTSAYTEYDFDKHIMEMYNMYPQALEEEWKLGHCHTHHTMSTFFSGQDQQELRDNTPNHAFYLSLIVNIKKEYCAKICVMGKRIVKETSNYSLNGIIKNSFKLKPFENTIEEEVVYTIDLDIVLPENKIFQQIKNIVKIKEQKEIEARNRIQATYPSNPYATGKQITMFDGYDADGYPTRYPFTPNQSFQKSTLKGTNPVLNSLKTGINGSQIEQYLKALLNSSLDEDTRSVNEILKETCTSYDFSNYTEKTFFLDSIDENIYLFAEHFWGDIASNEEEAIKFILEECSELLNKYQIKVGGNNEFIDDLLDIFKNVIYVA